MKQDVISYKLILRELPPSPGVKGSEASAVSEVSEVSVSTTPSPFPTSSVINFSELAKEQLSCPDAGWFSSAPYSIPSTTSPKRSVL